MGKWNSRLDVVEALERAGWIGDEERPLEILHHPNGAVWAIINDDGECGLDTPGGGAINFLGAVPDVVVVAACLAAAGGADRARGAEKYVVTRNEKPVSVADSLEAAQKAAWDRHIEGHPNAEHKWHPGLEMEWRLQCRVGGRGRFHWSTTSVHVVPEA
ncbi:hypothetical protein [Streptomyces albidoflavus]|uniref:hypothetical protein n=1 Tax=Streptomyces albidoflavus TaxID=1886 RepID=UPI0033E37F6C